MARALDRSPGMVSDEVEHHDGRVGYAACAAQAQAASAHSRCGRKPKLAADGALVADLLRRGWSPEQIAGRCKRTEDGVEQIGIAVSHEALYTALYALLRGELRRELDVWSQGLVVHSSRVNGRTRYGTGSARQRHHDSGSPSSDPA